jgi:hypothetical protein
LGVCFAGMSDQFLREQRTVKVWDEPQDVQLYQKSKSVWIAVGQYLGRTIEVQARTTSQALASWREAARDRRG